MLFDKDIKQSPSMFLNVVPWSNFHVCYESFGRHDNMLRYELCWQVLLYSVASGVGWVREFMFTWGHPQ